MAGKDNLMPFVKGDPRINRNGRPKSFKALRKLIQDTAGELAYDKFGEPIIDKETGVHLTRIEVLVRETIKSPRYAKTILAYGWGEPTKQIDLKTGPITVRMGFVEPEVKDDNSQDADS